MQDYINFNPYHECFSTVIKVIVPLLFENHMAALLLAIFMTFIETTMVSWADPSLYHFFTPVPHFLHPLPQFSSLLTFTTSPQALPPVSQPADSDS